MFHEAESSLGHATLLTAHWEDRITQSFPLGRSIGVYRFRSESRRPPQEVYVCDGAKPSKTGGESARKMRAAAKAFLTSTDSARVTRAAPPERCELATYVSHGLTQTPLRQTRPVFPQSASAVQVFGQPPMKHAGADVYSVREPTAQKISTTLPSQPQRPPGSMQ
jgi:hypothetical protein